ncbi:unnamed protein product [Notodromas monacha]|uniref:Uncharacterized protein n=1 Tax=Notodromas monacha TaxID=399045 RepID=A0A7R9BSV2_9CRUS|nr:unnamed protein product [Notodromas monacha]CAG0921113.1 unnamed protein product [Notodromas monacha]
MAIAEINDGRADVLADDQQELRGADSEGDTRCLSGEDIAARSATSAPGVAPNHPVPNPATDQTTGEHSISRSNDDSNEEMCRICLEGPGPGKRLITPCWCSVNCNFMKEAIFLTFWCTFLALVNIMSIEPAVEGWRGSVKSDDLLPLIQLVLTTMAIGHNSYLLMKCCLKLYASMKYCCDNHTHVTLMEEKRLLPRRQIERPVPVNRLPGLVESDDRAQAVNDAANGGQEEDRTSLGASVLPIDGTSADFFSLSSLTFRLPQSTSFDGSGMDREMRQGMPRTSENCSLPVRIFGSALNPGSRNPSQQQQRILRHRTHRRERVLLLRKLGPEKPRFCNRFRNHGRDKHF